MFESLQFPPDARILEVGFGYGNFASWASRQVPEGSVVAVDIDPEMLQWAHENYPAQDYPNLEFRLGDALSLDFEAEPFDYAMSNACLHYLDHPGKAFAPMARHLKPGGRLCVVCLGFGNLRELHNAFARVMREPQYAQHFLDFKPIRYLADGASCEPWLENAGLIKKQARLFNEVMHFSDRLNLQQWVNSSFAAYFDCLPGLYRPKFSDAVMDVYCRRTAPGQPVKAYRVWLQLEAVKRC